MGGMTSFEFTSVITAIANALANSLTLDEIIMFSIFFVQLGDTLATIAAIEDLSKNNKKCTS